MTRPYSAEKGGVIRYNGNKVFSEIEDVKTVPLSAENLEDRVASIRYRKMWSSISRINDRMNTSITQYFNKLNALFVPLPLTTRMISSPGAVYGKEAIDYTTDTCPITLDWFELPSRAFLAESSQIYLELALMQKGVDQVFANYHSFRKEEADMTHLSEFHHVEYEGKVDQNENVGIIKGLLDTLVGDLLHNNEADLAVFLEDEDMKHLSGMIEKDIPQLTLKEALDELYRDTKDEKYKRFSLQEFHSWEEIRLTQLVGGIVAVTEMPLLEVPFYHAMKDGSEPQVADNADIIWPGYRETIGSGHRVRSIVELEKKADIFNLPRDDYAPYLQSRQFSDYKETSGFGMGWERFIQGLLKMPFIYSASLFPRVHNTLRP
ncbi:MAG: amino acid--tRNA ligase-related protein [Candidatus Woesearchaeota archaeon]